ncbi:hypothetical protein A1F94_013868, partial [Pyrenophora tritici-repentis]
MTRSTSAELPRPLPLSQVCYLPQLLSLGLQTYLVFVGCQTLYPTAGYSTSPRSTKDWTPAPIGVRKVEQAQKDPKISKQIKDALNEWASRQQYRDKIQVDDGQPPSGGTSFVVHLLDT